MESAANQLCFLRETPQGCELPRRCWDLPIGGAQILGMQKDERPKSPAKRSWHHASRHQELFDGVQKQLVSSVLLVHARCDGTREVRESPWVFCRPDGPRTSVVEVGQPTPRN